VLDADRVRRNAPACLRERPQWVCWKYVGDGGKARKVPVNPATGGHADSTDPSTWVGFEDALEACRRFSALEGVGFVFTPGDEFCGVDLDDCIDLATGEMKPWGRRILEKLDSYSEVSPSGAGVKVFIRARKPGERCRTGYEDGEIEVYDRFRFFTVTGDPVETVDAGVRGRQQEVDALYAEVFGETCSAPSAATLPPQDASGSPVLADEDIIALAGDPRRKNGTGIKFAALFEGRWREYFRSPSEADSSLCWTLAYYTKDAAQIDRIFRASKLMRDKWDEPRPGGTYGSDTIKKALTRVTAQYRPRNRPAAPKPAADGGPPEDLPPLYRPDEVARLFVEVNRRTVYWRGVFHLYTGSCYRGVAEAELGARMAKFITDVGWWTRPARKDRNGQYEDGAVPHPDYDELMVVLEKVVPKTAHVREILLQLKTDYLPDTTDAPVWMSNYCKPPADELVACRNGLLHLPTGAMHGHSDELFALNAVEYAHDPDAPAPQAWMNFLADIFEGDDACIDTLQELFGYFLLPDTRQQKIALIVGPRRSGKGTIARVLTGMLGKDNVAGPTLGSLATNFGLWPLLHKPLAVISDARLSGRTDQAVVTERLLSISGEDAMTVDRKHLSPWTGKLPTRLLILTNELPKLTDASGALAGRFILLTLTKSFYGREDHRLTGKLLAELPGILNWSIEGWRRLSARGHFVQPPSSETAIQELEDLASPVAAFLRERCIVAADAQVVMDALFDEWKDYCQDSGRTHPGTKQSFGRDLKAALPTLGKAQPRCEGSRVRVYTGVRIDPSAQRADVGRFGTHGTRAERDWHAGRECARA
jgi:putative DNA primase/helicase